MVPPPGTYCQGIVLLCFQGFRSLPVKLPGPGTPGLREPVDWGSALMAQGGFFSFKILI